MEIIEKCNKTLEELYKFSTDILYLGEDIRDSRIENLEEEIGFKLPKDFIYIIKKHNGITLAGTEVYGLSVDLKGNSLDAIYKFEHFEVENIMPKNFFPFSPDGQGNHYCLDLSKLENNTCPVLFWQWDFEYENLEDVEVCNDNFIDWVQEVMIKWTLQTYNYNGTEK
ncbi:SMI1/KNR4 family protein [Kaistella flava (ex Peng et al. 2021)]|uniref:SMI1/KNR4 family protein n=1 Tax=Kaistella flava (ex Peng et al. 2021) TaxID=2038776 RepID=A0A7M2Y7K6_9FLAO|nr:SMI1/KNR4 family protein [Kaistella flava (ex Peng et al. 2021)]QOW10077.1 SMI1/KNR4 family protein [Kaistella flava (ex Peng et al. 2021)]QOW10086.1 SMI1/KNR4 family protein [Kaistella flava (ex Peng et al. 2021)]